ncbi:MAG: DUF4870 domain-containing protein [Gammaproteobacteria bacterium]|nr:DUF4870 domain-containing protein [Gammaproteobacteria bacterium]MCP5199562.1 DUF4870 domain-containing protein [Gammaproteobacteria bacterium]
MPAIRPIHVLALGLVLLVASAWPLGTALREFSVPRPVLVVADGVEADDVAVAVEPGRRARLALTLELAPGADDAYQVPVRVRVRDAAGADLLDVDTFVTPPGTMPPAGAATPAVNVFEYPPAGDALRIGALFSAFEVTGDGHLTLSLHLAPDSRHGAVVASARWRLEHDLGQPISALVVGVFMLVAGIVAASAGFVRRCGPRRADATSCDDATARRRAALCHLAGLLGYVVPFGNVVATLACWYAWRDGHAYIEQQGREAINFQLTILVYLLLAFALALALLGLVMVPLIALLHVVASLVAAYRARAGVAWRYPVTLRFA